MATSEDREQRLPVYCGKRREHDYDVLMIRDEPHMQFVCPIPGCYTVLGDDQRYWMLASRPDATQIVVS